MLRSHFSLEGGQLVLRSSDSQGGRNEARYSTAGVHSRLMAVYSAHNINGNSPRTRCGIFGLSLCRFISYFKYMTTMTIELPDQVAADAQGFIKAGFFRSEKEILLAALVDFLRRSRGVRPMRKHQGGLAVDR